MKIPFLKSKPPLSPEEITETIKTRAEREAAKIVAEAERRKKLAEAGKQTMSAAIFLIRATSWGILAAAAIISAAGFWYDGLFYWQQSDNLAIQFGLLGLALTLRLLSVNIPVVLQWAKPDPTKKPKTGSRFRLWPFGSKSDAQENETKDDEYTIRDVVASNRLARMTLRLIFIVSVLGCSVATLSFFASGPESRQAKVATIEATEAVATTNIAEKIAGLESQISALREDRDKAVATAQRSIDALAVDRTAVNDGPEYTKQYTDQQRAAQDYARTEIAKLNLEISNLRTGKQTAEATTVEDKSDNPPFLGVYRFLSRLDGSDGLGEEDWTIIGVVYFTIAFEFIIAFLLGAAYAVLLATNSIIRWISAREASHVMAWELKIAQHEADARLESLKAQAARDAQETAFQIDLARRKAKEQEQKAEADREIAEIERQAKEARERLEAIAGGEDPEAYDARKELEREKRRAEVDRRKAESERELATIRAETEKIRRDAEEASKPPESKPALTPEQQRAQNAGKASSFANDIKGNVIKIPVGAWSKRPDRVEQVRAAQ